MIHSEAIGRNRFDHQAYIDSILLYQNSIPKIQAAQQEALPVAQ